MFSSWRVSSPLSLLTGLVALSMATANTLDSIDVHAQRGLVIDDTCSYDPVNYNSETDLEFTSDPIKILSQDTDTVTFSVSQTWSDDVLCLISTYYLSADEAETGHVCPGVNNAGPGLLDVYTAKCDASGNAMVDLYVYDIALPDTCTPPAIPPSCEPREDIKTHRYRFSLPCQPDEIGECPELPDPVCADIKGPLSEEHFEVFSEIDSWLFGASGGTGTNNYLALDGSEVVEISKTFSIPTDAPSANLYFKLLEVDGWDITSAMKLSVGGYYLSLGEEVFTVEVDDHFETYFAEIHAQFYVYTDGVIEVEIFVPGVLFPDGVLDIGFRSDAMAIGIDEVKIELPCASPEPEDPNATCEEQNPCVKFTVSKLISTCGEECDYKVCMQMDLNKPACTALGMSVDKSCAKADGSCGAEGFLTGTPLNHLVDGDMQCQIVPVGGQAEFLLKDGDGHSGCGVASKFFQDGYQANCATYDEGESCFGDEETGGECHWTIEVPDDCNHNGGGGGDPHIRRWNRKRYSFHGECDLVMVHSDEFHDGDGLDLHIRTTINDWFSFIEAAALRVGEHTMEMHIDKFYVDGVEYSDSDLPITVGSHYQYTISPPTINHVTKTEGSKVYVVHLHDDSTVTFKIYASFITVAVSGHRNDFGDSTGLLGDFENGKMFDRAGERVYDYELFSHEWQVRPDLGEPLLFQAIREPQAPSEGCRMPLTTGRAHRRMRTINKELYEAAIVACSHTSEEDIDLCIDDVMMIGDVGVASAW